MKNMTHEQLIRATFLYLILSKVTHFFTEGFNHLFYKLNMILFGFKKLCKKGLRVLKVCN